MNASFSEFVASIESSLQRLLACPVYRRDTLPREMPIGGVYLFSESSRPLYVGRSQARLRDRIRDHGRLTNASKNASLAERLVLEALGALPPEELDRRFGTLFSEKEYAKEMMSARKRVSVMDIQFVEERHSIRRVLLEVYAAVALETPHNHF